MEQTAVRAWGNSQGIRIPKTIMESMSLNVNDVLDITVENDMIILKKAFRHKSFEERLSAYNGKISLCDFDWGDPAGKEMI
ncbi:MAG: AbrB/MazE/SpoVT family DNA-binding domain-containing protein [Lachnospiraceae bacterium]|nr:AbrB/MazE/SpoVT family DNA-binding domain-containing protein [Lachnospiraceae bacterium]